jgi:hypothetical protein
MTQPEPQTDILSDIVETLEARGLDPDEYQLYDSIDVEALEQLLSSATDVEVRFSVEGVRLVATPERVAVLPDEVPCSPPQ